METGNSFQVIYQDAEESAKTPHSNETKEKISRDMMKMGSLIAGIRKKNTYQDHSPLPNSEDVCWDDGMEGL